ncbi:hypothetical protein HPB48_013549 [Haemaphysalis longicornis]|uniref:Uncharacterized protein n=1 Tax=Haemaphysalis longicornis TaxID=44386 RepID=A0A9J6GB11_HAELO|nr:hypothetical protein HPB48_013549 [Haemaphysalis longicornis]
MAASNARGVVSPAVVASISRANASETEMQPAKKPRRCLSAHEDLCLLREVAAAKPFGDDIKWVHVLAAVNRAPIAQLKLFFPRCVPLARSSPLNRLYDAARSPARSAIPAQRASGPASERPQVKKPRRCFTAHEDLCILREVAATRPFGDDHKWVHVVATVNRVRGRHPQIEDPLEQQQRAAERPVTTELPRDGRRCPGPSSWRLSCRQ